MKKQHKIKKISNMKKEVKRHGDSLVLVFTAEEKRVYGIEEGMIADISDIIFSKRVMPKKKEFVLPDSNPSDKQKSGELDYWNDKYIKKPTIVKFTKKDGSEVKLKATKIIRRKN